MGSECHSGQLLSITDAVVVAVAMNLGLPFLRRRRRVILFGFSECLFHLFHNFIVPRGNPSLDSDGNRMLPRRIGRFDFFEESPTPLFDGSDNITGDGVFRLSTLGSGIRGFLSIHQIAKPNVPRRVHDGCAASKEHIVFFQFRDDLGG